MERLTVVLAAGEYTALALLAEQELRSLPDEVQAIVRERLHCVGLLGSDQEDRERVA